MPNRQLQVKPLFACQAMASICLSDKHDEMAIKKGKPRPRPGPVRQNNVRVIREALGLTIEETAERAGLSTSYLSRIERDGRNLSLKTIDALASALTVDRETIVVKGGRENQQPGAIFPWHEWQRLKPENRETVIRMIKGFPEASPDVNEEDVSFIRQPAVYFENTERPATPAKKSK